MGSILGGSNLMQSPSRMALLMDFPLIDLNSAIVWFGNIMTRDKYGRFSNMQIF